MGCKKEGDARARHRTVLIKQMDMVPHTMAHDWMWGLVEGRGSIPMNRDYHLAPFLKIICRDLSCDHVYRL
jgi:hypothetical protein